MKTFDLQVTIGSITFNDFTNPRQFYKVDNTRELVSTLSIERTETPRQGDHGTTDSLSRYGSRTLPFSGEIVAPTLAARVSMEKELRRALALSALQDYETDDGYQLVEFTLEGGDEVQCYAKVLQPPSFSFREEIPGRSMISRFSFAMVAKDPRLYSQTLESETGEETYEGSSFTIVQSSSPKIPFQLFAITEVTASCENEGTFDAPPVITITGPTDSPKVTNVTTGKFLRLDGLILDVAETATIDVSLRTIVKNDDTDLSGYLTSDSSWIVLVPGENELTLLDQTPSEVEATIEVEWRSTFI